MVKELCSKEGRVIDIAQFALYGAIRVTVDFAGTGSESFKVEVEETKAIEVGSTVRVTEVGQGVLPHIRRI